MKSKMNLLLFLAVSPFLAVGVLAARYKDRKRVKNEQKGSVVYVTKLIPANISADTIFTSAMSLLYYKAKFGHVVDEAGVSMATNCEKALKELEKQNEENVKLARKVHVDIAQARQIVTSRKDVDKPKKDLDIN